MDPTLEDLERHMEARPSAGPLAPDDVEAVLAWARLLTDAGYGWAGVDGHEVQVPEPSLVTVPEAPWHGVTLGTKQCVAFAAQLAGRPVVFTEFPPRLPLGQGKQLPVGGDFVRVGGRVHGELPSPGGFMTAPLPGHGRYAGLLLDGRGTLFGQEACTRVADLLALAARHGSPFPMPAAILGDAAEEAGDFPVLEGPGGRVPIAGPVTVGQDDRCDVSLEDELTSRRHAIVVPLIDGQVMVIDLRSSNGTFVNGEAVETRALEPGDVLHTKQRKWTLVFRRVRRPRNVSALPPGGNRIGLDVRTDQGASLLERVRAWTPAAASEGAGFRDYAAVAAGQLGLRSLILAWRASGKLRYCGVDVTEGPRPVAGLPSLVSRLLRSLGDEPGRTLSEPAGGLAPLPAGALGDQAVVAWTQSERSPRADAAQVAAVTATAIGPGETPALELPGDAAMEGFRERASRASSGRQCADLVHEVYRAGFPAEAVELGETMASRFLDAEEVEEALQEIRGAME